jgi:hypothetical protein
MSNQPPVGVGTTYFPTIEIPRGDIGSGNTPGTGTDKLRALPRRRRPAMMALAIALAGAGVVVSAALYQRADHDVEVVMVTAPVAAGGVIEADDLGTASVNVSAGVRVIPASQISQVAGDVAAVGLRPGTLIAPSELTSAQPPRPGQELVAVAAKPSILPATGLSSGDHVLVVATPGDQGQPGSQVQTPLTNPVPAVVEDVSKFPDQDGLDVIDLLVSNADGVAVAEQASTGQFALVVTRRSA